MRDNRIRSFFFLTILMLNGLSATGSIAAPVSAQTLHNASCRSCHKSIMSGDPDAIYVRENRRVNSYVSLQNQVNRCEANIGIDWSQKQINEVIGYLNQQFYKFKK